MFVMMVRLMKKWRDTRQTETDLMNVMESEEKKIDGD